MKVEDDKKVYKEQKIPKMQDIIIDQYTQNFDETRSLTYKLVYLEWSSNHQTHVISLMKQNASIKAPYEKITRHKWYHVKKVSKTQVISC